MIHDAERRLIARGDAAGKRLLSDELAGAIRRELDVHPEMRRSVRLRPHDEERFTNCIIEGKHLGFAT